MRLILAVALSYAIDGLILTGFAAAGVISFEIPLLYTLAGLSTTLGFALLRMWALKQGFGDGEFALSQVIVASALLLSFAAATPPPQERYWRGPVLHDHPCFTGNSPAGRTA